MMMDYLQRRRGANPFNRSPRLHERMTRSNASASFGFPSEWGKEGCVGTGPSLSPSNNAESGFL